MEEEKTIRRIVDNETGIAYPLEDDYAREKLDELEEKITLIENQLNSSQSID